MPRKQEGAIGPRRAAARRPSAPALIASTLLPFALGLLAAFVLRQTILAGRAPEPAAGGAAEPATGAAEEARRRVFTNLFLAGVEQFEKERHAEALETFRRAAAAYPGLPDAHHYIGEVHRKMFLNDQAEESWRRALSFDPKFWPSRKSLAMLLYEKGKFEEALRLLEAMRSERKPGEPPSSFVIGELALNRMALGDAAAAVPLLEEYNALEGRQAWGHAHLGRALALSGREREAEAAYREAIAIDSRFALAPYWLGQLLASAGREAEARPFLERYRELRALEDREHQLRMALLRQAGDLDTLVELARVRFFLGRPQDSLRALERARELAPADPRLAELWEMVSRAAAGRAAPPR